MCWGPRGVTQVRPTSRSTCVTDSRSNLISGPLSSPMVHVVWPLTYTHGPNTHTTHTRGHSDLTLGLSDLCSAYLASHGLAGLAVPERTVKGPTVCNATCAPATRPPRRTDGLLVVGGGGREGLSDLAPGLPDDLTPGLSETIPARICMASHGSAGLAADRLGSSASRSSRSAPGSRSSSPPLSAPPRPPRSYPAARPLPTPPLPTPPPFSRFFRAGRRERPR